MKAFIEDILEDRYIVRVENNKYFELPLITYKDYNFKRNIEISGELRYDKRKNTEYFEPKHPIYKINDKIDFQIIDMVIWEDKTYFVVKDCFENELRVHSLKWDKKETNKKIIYVVKYLILSSVNHYLRILITPIPYMKLEKNTILNLLD